MATKNNIERVYGLTPMQRGMLYTYLKDSNTSSYFIQKSIAVHGALNLDYVKASLRILGKKHSVLRTSIFHKAKGEPKQVVLANREIECIEVQATKEQVAVIEQQDKERGFDLMNDALLRVTIAHISDNENVLIWSFHHIILDGWCMAILLNDFFSFYHALEQGTSEENLIKTNRQIFDYGEYIDWLNVQNPQAAKEYWSNVLCDYSQDSRIRPTITLTKENKGCGEEVQVLSQEIREKVEELSRRLRVTFSSVIEFAWGLFLAKQNHLPEIVYGKVVSGRNANLRNIEKAVGLFINTIPVRLNTGAEKFCDELIRELQSQSLDSERFDYYPLYEVAKVSEIGGELIHSLYIFENYYVDKSEQANTEGLDIEIDNKQEETEYALSLAVIKNEQYEFHINYNKELLSVEEAKLAMAHFVQILTDVVCSPHKQVQDITMISGEEEQKIVTSSYGEQRELEFESIIERLEEQIDQCGERIALQCEDQKITYTELGARVNAVATSIAEHGVTADDRVLVLCEKSIEMIIGIYAAIKCGCTYIPVEKGIPSGRIDYIVKDSEAKLVLTDDSVEGIHLPYINVKTVTTGVMSVNSGQNRKHENLYILYTSGTTGTPKGVEIKEQAVINLVNYLNRMIYSGYEHTDVALIASPMFDASVQQIFTALLYGHTLHLITDRIKQNTGSMWEYLNSNHIMITDGTPSYIELLFHSNEGQVETKEYIIGGEALKPELIDAIAIKTTDANVYNVYGPTETTVDVTCYLCKGVDAKKNSVSIGTPIDNTGILIMNGNSLCGIGMIGEICIAGIGLFSGYLNNDTLTREKMRYVPGVDQTLFLSGDLGYWNQDGMIEIIGRNDSQIKIHGYRIEIEEIEQLLLLVEEILKASVVCVEQNLVAFVKAANPVSTEHCMEFLMKKLPYYMIPSRIIQIDEMPMTLSGKTDLKKLKELAVNYRKETGHGEAKATNEEEELLVSVYQKILNVEHISIDDNFYSLGGDSIQAIRIISQLNDYDIKINDILRYPQIRQLAKFLKSKKSNISQEEVAGDMILLPAYKQFLNSASETSYNHFNQSMLIKSEQPVNRTALSDALAEVVKVHDGLRIRYRYGDEKAEILPASKVQTAIEEIECRDAQLNQTATEYQQSFKLEEGLAIRVVVLKTESSEYILIILHHFASDAISMRIIFDDLFLAYQCAKEGTTIELPKKTYSIVDWGKRLQEIVENHLLEDEVDFWKEQISALPESEGSKASHSMALHSKQQTELCSVGESKYYEVRIHKKLTTQLRDKLNYLPDYNLQDVLLTCYSMAQMKAEKTNDMTVFMESHGRDDKLVGLNVAHTVGWFTAVYPLHIRFDNNHKAIQDRMSYIRGKIDCVPNNGIGYSVLSTMTNELSPVNTQAATMFNYLGEFSNLSNEELGLHWEPLSMGKEVSDQIQMQNRILVNMAIRDGELYCNLRYDSARIKEWKIKQIVRFFEANLKKLVNLDANELLKNGAFGYLNQSDQDYVNVINKTGTKNVFLFPPAMLKVAYLPVYEKLFAPYEELKLHVFHLTATQGMSKQYAAYIMEQQMQEPYLFIGYSGGANIAYDTALYLQKEKGIHVNRIVMIDGFKWQTGLDFVTLTEENIDGMLKDFLESSNMSEDLLQSPQVQHMIQMERANFLKEAETYQGYCDKHKNRFEKLEKVAVYNLLSEDVFEETEKDTRHGWNQCIEQDVQYIEARGSHLSMLNDRESLKYNREIIYKLVKETLMNKKDKNNKNGMSNKKEILIKAENVKKAFGKDEAKVQALAGVDLEVYQGEFVVIFGTSGSGKSTLLNVLSTLESPDEGRVSYYNETINYKSRKQVLNVRKNHIGFIFQQYHLIPNLTVHDNVEVGNYLAENKTDIEEILKAIGLEKKMSKYPSQLSGGEQQRVSIARALAKQTNILFCDEPTGALDTNTGIKVLKLLQEVQKERGVTIVIVTHNNLIANIADRVVYMRDGNITKIEENQTRMSVEEVEWV